MSPKKIALATMTALMANDASAQAIADHDRFSAPNLSGIYRCVRNCAAGGLGRITAYGWNLTLTNEVGQTTRAWIDVPGHIWIPALKEGQSILRTALPFSLIAAPYGCFWSRNRFQELPGSRAHKFRDRA